ncbi:hypothetical protein I4U23_010854 [Adineta vaga]|nr:hypothetical protein I4U23_010854 [Adineta vaga]
MSSEIDFLQSLALTQMYLYQVGGVFLMVTVYLTIANYYGLTKTILIPILMLICEVCTIKNIQSAHRTRVIPLSTVTDSVLNPPRSKDH